MIPALMLIGVGLAVNNTWAVFEGLTGRVSPFHRTPKKGAQHDVQYRPIKDATCLVEILLGVYCLAAYQYFLCSASAVVTLFLVIYAAGFLFVGLLSIAHYRRPEYIDYRLRLFRPARSVA
jgi:hypothetical protein